MRPEPDRTYLSSENVTVILVDQMLSFTVFFFFLLLALSDVIWSCQSEILRAAANQKS